MQTVHTETGGKYNSAIAASVEIQFFYYTRTTDNISLTTCIIHTLWFTAIRTPVYITCCSRCTKMQEHRINTHVRQESWKCIYNMQEVSW
jgi:hypothetical protein